MSVRTALTCVALTLMMSWQAQAQIAFNKNDVPSHTALNRVGLERQWHQVVPLYATERVLGVSMASSANTIKGAITDPAPTAISFRGGYELSPLNGTYKHFHLMFLDGPLKDQIRAITGYQGETRTFLFGQPFTEVPTKGAKFALLDPLVFVQTSENHFYCYDGESGRLLWQVKSGDPVGKVWPASVNSRAVFATSGNRMIALDRQNGERLWSIELPYAPTSPTACDEDLVMVGLDNGRLLGYHTRSSSITSKVAKSYDVKIGVEAYPTGMPFDIREHQLLAKPVLAWVWKTDGAFKSRPLPTPSMVLFGSADGRLYGTFREAHQRFFSFLTGGGVVGPLSSYGVRTALVPSLDHNLYAVDIFTGNATWTFPSGSPIVQEPLVAGEDVFVQNTDGVLSVLDPKTGEKRWSVATNESKLIAIGKSKLYAKNWAGDLIVVDRKSGAILDNGRSIREVKGLDMRGFTITLTNSINDRLYFVTPSGSLVCLRELDQSSPRPLRDASQPAFGFVPPEGYPDATAPVVPPTAVPDTKTDAEPPM